MNTTSSKSKQINSERFGIPGLLENVHAALKPPSSGRTLIVRGVYNYYHYGCDGSNDHGWGCAYRTLQTICSWIAAKQTNTTHCVLPSIPEIQTILADLECRPIDFVGSRTWIGAMEVFFVIDKLFGTKCRILHMPKGEGFSESNIKKLIEYFERFEGICMMGGDTDASSKGIAGIHIADDNDSENHVYLLVIDPHYPRRPKSAEELIDAGYVRWQHISHFIESSFYNICMPELE